MANFVEQPRKQPDDGHGQIVTLPDPGGHATVLGYYGPVQGPGLDTDLVVRWYSSTPWEVELEFRDNRNGKVASWLVGRQLLREGGGLPEGDLMVFRNAAPSHMQLTLRSPNGCAVVGLDTAWIDELIAGTDAVVTAEREFDNDALFVSWSFDFPFFTAAFSRPRGPRAGDPGPAWPTEEWQPNAEPPGGRQ